MDASPLAPRPRRRGAVALSLVLLVLVTASLLVAGTRRREERPARGQASLAVLTAETAAVRELEFRDPVAAEYLSSDELERVVREGVESGEFATVVPPEPVLRALDLLPPDRSLEEILAEGTAAGVIGFYDPETKRLVVESGSGSDLSPLAQTTLVHELTHAVTDQHFGLDRVVSGEEPPDELAARLGLVEGDATLTMSLWTAEHLSVGDQINLGFEAAGLGLAASGADTPAFISALTIAPYTDGLRFVQRLHDSGGWVAVDDAYASPPRTTEQILHPEVYRSGDTGDQVTPPDPPPGHRVRRTGALGELFLRTILAGDAAAALPGLGPAEAAARGAAGWDGDAYTVSSGPEGTAITLEIHWDAGGDDAEFREALETWFDTRYAVRDRSGDGLEGGGRCLRFGRAEALTTTVVLAEGSC